MTDLTPEEMERLAGVIYQVATVHWLKTLPTYFAAVERGDKTFEVRRDDRGFQRGDVLVLWRYDPMHPVPQDQAPRVIRHISYVLTGGQFGIEPGYVVLGLQGPAPKPETGSEG